MPMPPPVKDVFEPLHQKVLTVTFLWKNYVQVFASSPANIALLNNTANHFFGTVQRVMGNEISLSIFRLLDPATQAGKTNLTLQRLVDVVTADDPSLGAGLAALLTKVKADMAPYVDLRNKVLAHNDLLTAQAQFQGGGSVTGPPFRVVRQALQDVAGMMNRVSSHYAQETTIYDTSGHPDPGDGYTLILNLELLDRYSGLIDAQELERRIRGEG